jgi:hypothetical protein
VKPLVSLWAICLTLVVAPPGSSNMPAILDLRVQLADRVKRSKALIEFINANGLLGKVSCSGQDVLSSTDPVLTRQPSRFSCLNRRGSSSVGTPRSSRRRLRFGSNKTHGSREFSPSSPAQDDLH